MKNVNGRTKILNVVGRGPASCSRYECIGDPGHPEVANCVRSRYQRRTGIAGLRPRASGLWVTVALARQPASGGTVVGL
jgi:hypothetical protein